MGINLTKEVKDLYTEKCKTLLKEAEGDTNEQKDTPLSWTGRINVKMSKLPQNNLQVHGNPYQNSKGIFHRIRTILKFVWNHK